MYKRQSEDTQFLAQRRLSTQHLIDRGYHPDLIDNAFDKFSDLAGRKDLYSLKDKSDKATGMIPMVMDHNPALPNIINNICKISQTIYSRNTLICISIHK